MLMRFSVSNFMSFGYKIDENENVIPEEFHMYAGRSEQFKERVFSFDGRKVLKFASVYGANASGKTNLIHAINCGRNILIHTLEKENFGDKYCRSKVINQTKPSQFEYEFTIGNRAFAYGFTVNLFECRIISEWLYELVGSTENIIFERITENNQYYFDESLFTSSENLQQFHFFIKDANRVETSLLLYELKRRNLEEKDFEIFNKIYKWFQYKLIIIYPETKFGDSYRLFADDNKKLIDILDYLDTGITEYSLRELNESAFLEYFPDTGIAEHFLRAPKKEGRSAVDSILRYGDTLFELKYEGGETPKIKKLMFQHGLDENHYDYGEESDGTQRLIELLGIILNEDEEKVFIIDELDRSLHPKMTIKFVETFFKLSQNKKNQLIITTHESNLMDFKILRRDEIWLTEREVDNTTTLIPFEKFKTRVDKVVSKDYLEGRYGAVPIFKDFEYMWGRD